MGLCSSSGISNTHTNTFDFPAYCANLKLNHRNMPILIIKTNVPNGRKSTKQYAYVDGTLPMEVFNDFGFVTGGSANAGTWNQNPGCHFCESIRSAAVLLSVLVDQHGWELLTMACPSNQGSSVKEVVYCLTKKAV